MKLIHCADLHLDSKMNTHLGSQKAKERKTELLHTFTRMIDYAKDENVKQILIAGDLFDTRKVSATASNMVLELIQKNDDISFYYLRAIDQAAKRINFRSAPGAVVVHITFEHGLHLFPGFLVDDCFVLSLIKAAFVLNHTDIKVIFEHPVNHLVVDLLTVALNAFSGDPCFAPDAF